MTTTTTTKSSATGAMLERLAAADPPLQLSFHAGELLPWVQAAAVGDFELPEPVLGLVRMAERLAAQRAAITRPPTPNQGQAAALLAGASLTEILGAEDEAAARLTLYRRQTDLVDAAEGYLPHVVRDTFIPLRDGLITGPLREAVASVLSEAKKTANKLQQYAPRYDTALLASGSDSEFALWRSSRQLQVKFDTLLRAWFVSYAADSPADLRPTNGRPGGWLAWTEPDAVKNADVRYGRDTEVLRVAAEHGEYRPVAPSEIDEIIAAIEAGIPRDAKGNLITASSPRDIVRRDVCR